METPEHQRIRPLTECPGAPIRRRIRRRLEEELEPEPLEVFFVETIVTEDGRVQSRSGIREVEDDEEEKIREKGFFVKTYHSTFFHQIVLIKKN